MPMEINNITFSGITLSSKNWVECALLKMRERGNSSHVMPCYTVSHIFVQLKHVGTCISSLVDAFAALIIAVFKFLVLQLICG